MKKFVLILFILLISNIAAGCDKDQVDINSASLEELDEIIWVGEATAEKIIENRPFKSVDSLIEVSGIGEIKLEDIKKQGLACVDEEPEEQEESLEEKERTENIISEPKEKEIDKEPELIKLNAKSINSEENNENLNKNNYAIYGLFVFCVLLGFLFAVRRRRYNKNEFR